MADVYSTTSEDLRGIDHWDSDGEHGRPGQIGAVP